MLTEFSTRLLRLSGSRAAASSPIADGVTNVTLYGDLAWGHLIEAAHKGKVPQPGLVYFLVSLPPGRLEKSHTWQFDIFSSCYKDATMLQPTVIFDHIF